jgi:hypothetical protein
MSTREIAELIAARLTPHGLKLRKVAAIAQERAIDPVDIINDGISGVLAARSGLTEWQPIESAPKDGTNILAAWADTWPKNPHAEAMYFSDGGWWYSYDGDGHSRPPTHWMPLPQLGVVEQ